MPANLRKVNKIDGANVRECFDYDYVSGRLTWKERPSAGVTWNLRFAGKIAGCLHSEGYVVVKCFGERYRAHRLAWLYMTGEWPSYEIDHINGDRADNRFINLREASHGENNQNLAKQKRPTTSKYIGVSYRKSDGAWVAQIKGNDRTIFLGAYASEQRARDAYRIAKEKYHKFQPKIRANAEGVA